MLNPNQTRQNNSSVTGPLTFDKFTSFFLFAILLTKYLSYYGSTSLIVNVAPNEASQPQLIIQANLACSNFLLYKFTYWARPPFYGTNGLSVMVPASQVHPKGPILIFVFFQLRETFNLFCPFFMITLYYQTNTPNIES